MTPAGFQPARSGTDIHANPKLCENDEAYVPDNGKPVSALLRVVGQPAGIGCTRPGLRTFADSQKSASCNDGCPGASPGLAGPSTGREDVGHASHASGQCRSIHAGMLLQSPSVRCDPCASGTSSSCGHWGGQGPSGALVEVG